MVGKTMKSPSKNKTAKKKTAAKLTLLSGGNPQIAKAEGDAPVQAYIAAMPGWKRDVGRRLDALIARTVPGVRKAVKWNSPFYGVEDQGWFLNFHVFTNYVKVAFFRGASLRPVPPGESKHAEVRYFDVREDAPIDEVLMESWIRQAAALPGWTGTAAGVAAKTATPRRATAATSRQTSASKRIDKAIADLDDWRGRRLAEIRALIHEVDPRVIEEWKWMGTPVWSHQGMYALANAHKDKVKLTFHHGAQLADPKKLFNAGLEGSKWRAIDFREGDKIDRIALKALLRKAVAYNSTHAVPKSKGSKA